MKLLAAFCLLGLIATSSALATVVYWGLDPDRTGGTADSANHAFLSSSSSISGNGYAGEWQSHIPPGQHDDFSQIALAHHQWRENGYSSTESVQLDINSILSQNDTDGKFQLGNVHLTSNDAFPMPGSPTLRDSRMHGEGINGGLSDTVFASMADLTNGKLTSAGSVSESQLTFAFQTTVTPVPEISALFPIIGLVAAVAVTQFLRRRRIARVRAASLDAN